MKFIVGILLCFISILSLGQGKTSFAFDGGLPTGSGSEDVGFGLGVSLRREGKISTHTSWLASAGYMYFGAHSTDNYGNRYEGHYDFIPILVGLKIYPKECFKGFYVGTDFGVTIVSLKAGPSGYFSSGPPISERENKFTLVPQVGWHNKGMDLAVRYNYVSGTDYYGFKLSFMLN